MLDNVAEAGATVVGFGWLCGWVGMMDGKCVGLRCSNIVTVWGKGRERVGIIHTIQSWITDSDTTRTRRRGRGSCFQLYLLKRVTLWYFGRRRDTRLRYCTFEQREGGNLTLKLPWKCLLYMLTLWRGFEAASINVVKYTLIHADNNKWHSKHCHDLPLAIFSAIICFIISYSHEQM